jgi:hypothetical protein
VPLLSKQLDFDSKPDSCWHSIVSRIIPESLYKTSGVLTDSILYGATLSLKNAQFLLDQLNLITIELDVQSSENVNNSYLTVSVDEDGKSKHI